MRRLTRQAVEDKEDFELNHEGCSCHIHPPCSSCTHPGNPEGEHETEDIEPIYWQQIECECVGIVWSHKDALDIPCADVYINKELFVERIKQGWTLL